MESLWNIKVSKTTRLRLFISLFVSQCLHLSPLYRVWVGRRAQGRSMWKIMLQYWPVPRQSLRNKKSVKTANLTYLFIWCLFSTTFVQLYNCTIGAELGEHLKGDKCEKSCCSTGQYLSNPSRTWKCQKQRIWLIYLDAFVQMNFLLFPDVAIVCCSENTIKNP